MFVSYRWLSRHVDLTDISAEQLAADLTLSTAEVEGVEAFAPHLSDVTVGHVVERSQHPDADKLSVCLVDVGGAEQLQIVCGAPNVRQGLKVAVATIGTRLPGDFKIKKSKIRGVESRGMICSVRELDLGDEHDGIWELPDDAEVGRSVAAALDMQDWVIEIDNKSLTHRPDLWGHRGIAGEVAAIYDRELKPLDTSLPATGSGTPIALRIESQACPRYLGLSIDGARPLPSPSWLRNLLLAVGQRPFDQLVDLSNFVMFDLGQPNHTFDRAQLSADGIVVRDAREGETMQTLDGEERKLLTTDMLICSGEEPVALAGIMGGEGSKVGENTEGLLLEVANFHPVIVRRTSARLGLRTDASARFEKSLDPTLPMQAAGHYARLLSELQPEVSFPAPIADAGDWSDPSTVIELRTSVVNSKLGKELPAEEIAGILRRIGFGVEEIAAGFRVSIPARRATKDITIEQDLVEEVGRIHRYGNIPEQLMTSTVAPAPRDERRLLVRRVQDRLAGAARFHEVLSYSFQPDSLLAKLGILDLPHVEVINPMAEGESKVRRSVLPSLLAVLETNRRHRDEVSIFEVGKGYRPEEASAKGEPAEVHQLALAWARPPLGKKAAFDAARLQHLQAAVDDLIQHLGLEAPVWSQVEDAPSWAHPAKCIVARWPDVEGDVALLAELEPGLARDLGLAGELASDVAVGEVSIDLLLADKQRPTGYKPIPRFPGIKVDVAILVDDACAAADLQTAIERAGKGQVASTEVFDLYRGERLGAGKKSLAYHVLLQSPTKTLTDKDGQKFLTRLENQLGRIGAELRKG